MKMPTKNSYPEDLSYTALDNQLRQEMVQGEKFRLFILAIVFAVLLIISSFVYILYQEELNNILKSNVFIWILILLGVLLLRSFNIQKLIDYRLRKGKTFNPLLRYVNIVFEVSIPTVLILIISQNITPIYAMTTPIVFFYFIFIVLSTLELNFKISLFTGAIAACQFFLLSLYFQSQTDLESIIPTYRLTAPFAGKAGIMFLTGIVAGLVAHEIRKQYSITGNVVILASRLEQLNKKYDSSILISKEVYDKIDQKSTNAQDIGSVNVKGRQKPIEIYQLA